MIIDGRIADIMKTGFIEGQIVIPEFVLVELRHIADSSDALKRNRGRRGLDILNKIQNEYGVEIYNSTGEKSLDEIPEVDVKLLKLAQIMNGKVVTNDFNLNKVACGASGRGNDTFARKGRQGEQSGCCISGRWHDDSCRGRQTLHRTDDKSRRDERAADFGRPYDIRKACRQRQRSSSWIVKRKFQ